MDPITAIGAVASIVQLAQTALSLSKTLYSLGSAISSAADDLHTLADDLETFSTSLTILSRQLEDSKSWYSDEVYLLTGKIIRDCAELYSKIDVVLVKLGSKGKAGWKLRVKFVYKEAQIRKLMKRLRDMKSTLATILLTLQLDFQLTWLDISSSSKIQRAPEKPLQAKTIKSLEDAQKFMESSEVHLDLKDATNLSEKGLRVSSAPHEQVTETPQPEDFGISSISSNETPSIQIQEHGPIASRGLEMNAEKATGWRSFQFSNFVLQPQMESETYPGDTRMLAKSLKSSSSIDSFKSAEETHNAILHDIKALQSIMHAFRTALEILDKLVQRRVRKDHEDIYFSAKYLNTSLTRGEKETNDTHKSHCREYGQLYISTFTESHTTALQNVSSILMREVVMVLHVYTAEHEEIHKSDFDSLYSWSEMCRTQAIFQIDKVVSLIQFPPKVPWSSKIHPFERRPESVQLGRWNYKYDWKSVPEEHDSSIDSNPASGENANSGWSWGISLARAIGWAKKSHRPLSTKSSVVDPRLFGRVNSLHGLVDESVGFDEVSWSSSSDFGQQSSNRFWSNEAATSSLQHVQPIEPIDPFLFQVTDSDFEDSRHRRQLDEPMRHPILAKASSSDQLIGTVRGDIHQDEGPLGLRESVEQRPRPLPIQLPQPIPVVSHSPPQRVHRVGLDSVNWEGSNVIQRNTPAGLVPVDSFVTAVGAAVGAAVVTDQERERRRDDTRDRREIELKLDNTEVKDDQRRENLHDLARKDSSPLIRASGMYMSEVYHALPSQRLDHVHPELDLGISTVNRRAREMDEEMERYRERERDDTPYLRLDAKLSPEREARVGTRRKGQREEDRNRSTRSESPPVPDQSDTDTPSSDLWWEACISFTSTHSDMVESLENGLRSKVGFFEAEDTWSGDFESRRVSKLMIQLLTIPHASIPELRAVTEIRAKIIKVIMTIDQQLGVQIATLAWGCVYVVLAQNEKDFTPTTPQIPQEDIEALTTSFSQLLQIVGIIARYAVMENLYKQNRCLTIRADYQAAILDICVTILEYFAYCFELARAGAEKSESLRRRCAVLVEEAVRKDEACRSFAVVIEESGSESGSESDSDERDVDYED